MRLDEGEAFFIFAVIFLAIMAPIIRVVFENVNACLSHLIKGRKSERENVIMAALRNADEVAQQERASHQAAIDKITLAERERIETERLATAREREVRLPLFRDRKEE